MGGLGGSVWVGVMRFHKIFGLYGVERHKVENWSGQVSSWWVWWVCVGDGSVDRGCNGLSENVEFVWCILVMSLSGEMVRSAGFWVGLCG